MNAKQKIILLITAAVILLMFAFPPFHVVHPQVGERNMGYGFILNPPEFYSTGIGATVNSGMLLVQWVGVLILGGLAFFLLKGKVKALSEVVNPPAGQIISFSESKEEKKVFFGGIYPFLGGIHHPWRRFFARFVDVSFFSIVLAFVVGALFPESVEGFVKMFENPIIASFIVYLAWMPVEAVFLSSLGTTPAKWLFGIRVISNRGKLPFDDAAKRTILVWIKGLGFGLPLVSLLTMLYAYRRLTKTGTTLWDTSAGTVVIHNDWGARRTILCILSVLLIFSVSVMGTTLLKEKHQRAEVIKRNQALIAKYPLLKDRILRVLEAGFDENDIETYIQSRIKEDLDAGFSQQEIDRYATGAGGDTTPSPTPTPSPSISAADFWAGYDREK